MKQVQVTTRSQWRRWLAENHDQETDGIWLIFTRKETGRPPLEYEESVEEALCFGWIAGSRRFTDRGGVRRPRPTTHTRKALDLCAKIALIVRPATARSRCSRAG